MSDDYLWDRSGTPDPGIAKLESLLREFRYKPIRVRRSSMKIKVAAAALLVLGAAGLYSIISGALEGSPKSASKRISYALSSESGAIVLEHEDGTRSSAERSVPQPVREGTWIVTNAGDRVVLRAEGLSELSWEGAARLKFSKADDSVHRFELERGKINVRVPPPPIVPPRLFQVGTPRGVVVDLGCRYELSVDETGATSVEVLLGCIVFESEDGQCFVPWGHRFSAQRGLPMGVPVAIYTSTDFAAALRVFEADDGPAGRRAFQGLLETSTSSDCLTLWHLLSRVGPDDRRLLVSRLCELRDIRDGELRAALQSLDEKSLTSLRISICGF